MKVKMKLAAAMIIFGSIGLFVREIDLSSGRIALYRGITGSLFLLTATAVTKQSISWKAIKDNLWLLFLCGGAIGFNWILLFEAYRYTTIANATLSYYFAPVFVMVAAPFLLQERLTKGKCLCLVSAVAGMFLISGAGRGEGSSHLTGIVFGLMAAGLYAGVVLSNKFLKGLSGIETTLIQLTIAAVVLLPYIIKTEGLLPREAEAKTVFLVLVVGIVHTGFAYYLYFTAIKDLPGHTIAVYSYIDPIGAILLSALFLGEGMTMAQLAGGALILGAAAAGELGGFGRRILGGAE